MLLISELNCVVKNSKTADSYHSELHSIHWGITPALELRSVLLISELNGEEHSETADSYHSVGVTQHSLGNYTAALESRSVLLISELNCLVKSILDRSYHSVGVTQHSLGNYTAALE